jgi:hypothetical protein
MAERAPDIMVEADGRAESTTVLQAGTVTAAAAAQAAVTAAVSEYLMV